MYDKDPNAVNILDQVISNNQREREIEVAYKTSEGNNIQHSSIIPITDEVLILDGGNIISFLDEGIHYKGDADALVECVREHCKKARVVE